MSINEYQQLHQWADELTILATRPEGDAIKQKVKAEALRIATTYKQILKKIPEPRLRFAYMQFQTTYLMKLMEAISKLPKPEMVIVLNEILPPLEVMHEFFTVWELENPSDEKKNSETIIADNLQKIEDINSATKLKKRKIWILLLASFFPITILFNALSAYTVRGTLACPGKSKSPVYLLFVPVTSPAWDWSVCDLKTDSTDRAKTVTETNQTTR